VDACPIFHDDPVQFLGVGCGWSTASHVQKRFQCLSGYGPVLEFTHRSPTHQEIVHYLRRRQCSGGRQERFLRQIGVSERATRADGNAVAAENATAIRDLFGKSIFVENQAPGRTNRYAYSIALALTGIHCDLTHD
jgi:hypothetical protein